MQSIGLLTFQKKLLLIQNNSSSTKSWDLLNGLIGEDDTYEVAIRRELKSGLNLSPESVKFLVLSKDESGEKTCWFHIALSTDESKSLKDNFETKTIQYFAFEELSKLKLSQSLKQHLATDSEQIKNLLS